MRAKAQGTYLVERGYLDPIRRQLDNGTEIASQVGAADRQEGSNGQHFVGHSPDVQLLPGVQSCLRHRVGRAGISATCPKASCPKQTHLLNPLA